MRIKEEHTVRNFALIMLGSLVAGLLVFYALVGAICLHLNKPEPPTIGGCINEVGTTWCKMENL